jgi:hypothetical protein
MVDGCRAGDSSSQLFSYCIVVTTMMIDRKNLLSTLRYTQTNCVNEGKKKESEGADEPAAGSGRSLQQASTWQRLAGQVGQQRMIYLCNKERTKLSCQFMCVQQMKHLDWQSESLPCVVCVYAVVSCISVKV